MTNLMQSIAVSPSTLMASYAVAVKYRVIFSLVPPNFSDKTDIANKPITAAVPVNLVTKKGRDWLLGGFLSGTEIGGYQ